MISRAGIKRTFSSFFVIGIIFLLCGCQDEVRSIQVSSVVGDMKVERVSKSGPFSAVEGMNLEIEDGLQTMDKSSSIISVDQDKTVEVYENVEMSVSQLVGIAQQNSETAFDLKNGKIFIRIQKALKPDESFEISTPNCIMGVRGTQFYVIVENGETDVIVLEGKVEIALLSDLNQHIYVKTNQRVHIGRGVKSIDELEIRPLDQTEIDELSQSRWALFGKVTQVKTETGVQITYTTEGAVASSKTSNSLVTAKTTGVAITTSTGIATSGITPTALNVTGTAISSSAIATTAATVTTVAGTTPSASSTSPAGTSAGPSTGTSTTAGAKPGTNGTTNSTANTTTPTTSTTKPTTSTTTSSTNPTTSTTKPSTTATTGTTATTPVATNASGATTTPATVGASNGTTSPTTGTSTAGVTTSSGALTALTPIVIKPITLGTLILDASKGGPNAFTIVNRTNFEKIKMWDSLALLKRYLGEPTQDNQYASAGNTGYKWTESTGMISVSVNANGQVVDKYETGLETADATMNLADATVRAKVKTGMSLSEIDTATGTRHYEYKHVIATDGTETIYYGWYSNYQGSAASITITSVNGQLGTPRFYPLILINSLR